MQVKVHGKGTDSSAIRPLHVLELPSFFPPAGGLFCLDQAKALVMLGNEVRILSNVQLSIRLQRLRFFTYSYRRHWKECSGITVYQSYQRGIPKVVRPNVEHWCNIVRSMFRDCVKKYGIPDILHAHCASWAGYTAMLISREYGIPYVITEHYSRLIFEKELGPPPSSAWEIPLLRAAYEHASLVIPVAEELVDSIACYFGRNYRWKAISNTIDVDFFRFKERPLRTHRPFRFCCIANNIPLKGYDVLLPAFRSLERKGMNVELHIAGRHTDLPSFVEQLDVATMYSHGMMDKKGVRQLLYDCDALVLASRSEVQPLVLLEAMSTGIPVVGTECVPKSLRLPMGCRIVPTDNVQMLAEAMEACLTWNVDGRQLSEHIRQIASPQVIGKQLSEVFAQCCSK